MGKRERIDDERRMARLPYSTLPGRPCTLGPLVPVVFVVLGMVSGHHLLQVPARFHKCAGAADFW